MANTIVWGEEWAIKLQERLDHPTTWSEILKVDYSNTRVLHNPYLSTEPSVATGTRGTAYTFSDFAQTDQTRTINNYRVIPVFIDRADLAQSTFSSQMYLAELQGIKIQEYIEAQWLAQYASFTAFGNGSLTGGSGTSSTQITVGPSNIANIIRGVKRVIRVANGQKLAARNGIGFVWRPADFEILEAFVQANGFREADYALKEGVDMGLKYMGCDHYFTNDFTANHIFAGVKKLGNIGILRDTYSQIVVTQDPNLQSGIGVISRVDYGFAWWNNYVPVLLNINVA